MVDQEFQTSSPTPQTPVQPVTYLFFDALKEIQNGRRITKAEWENEAIFCQLVDDQLMIKTYDGLFHPWTISTADMLGDDWYILPEGN